MKPLTPSTTKQRMSRLATQHVRRCIEFLENYSNLPLSVVIDLMHRYFQVFSYYYCYLNCTSIEMIEQNTHDGGTVFPMEYGIKSLGIYLVKNY